MPLRSFSNFNYITCSFRSSKNTNKLSYFVVKNNNNKKVLFIRHINLANRSYLLSAFQHIYNFFFIAINLNLVRTHGAIFVPFSSASSSSISLIGVLSLCYFKAGFDKKINIIIHGEAGVRRASDQL